MKQIQSALIAHGYKVVADGQFGAQTSAAVVAFQKQAGLSADGVVGPLTWARLSGSTTATTAATKTATSTTVKTTTTTVKTATTTTVH